MTTTINSGEVWRWVYPIERIDKIARIVALIGGLLYLIGCYFLVGFQSPPNGQSRSATDWLLAIAFPLFALAAVIHSEYRYYQSKKTSLHIDDSGLLTFTKGNKAESVDLRTSSEPVVRRRVSSGAHSSNSVRERWSWSVECLTPSGAWHQEFANAPLNRRLSQKNVDLLEGDLARWSAWASRGQAQPGATPAQAATTAQQSQFAATDRFEWTPELKENAANILKYAKLARTVIVAIAVAAVLVTQIPNGLANVAIFMIGPAFVALFITVIVKGLGQAENYRIVVEEGVLSASIGKMTLASAPIDTIQDIKVEQVATSSSGSNSGSRASWYLIITADKPVHHALLPDGANVIFGSEQAITLEAQLRQFLN